MDFIKDFESFLNESNNYDNYWHSAEEVYFTNLPYKSKDLQEILIDSEYPFEYYAAYDPTNKVLLLNTSRPDTDPTGINNFYSVSAFSKAKSLFNEFITNAAIFRKKYASIELKLPDINKIYSKK